jgi:hypothetical protein
MLATEHWSLLATRSQTWNEVMSRIMAQFTFTSAVLVVLALVVQQSGADGPFRALALGLGAAVLLTGTLTQTRVTNASQEDAAFVRGMNRLRRAYVDLDPGIERYLVTGIADDDVGMGRTYTMGPSRDVSQVLASAAMFIGVVNSLVCGGWVGILAAPAGRGWAIAIGVVAGLTYLMSGLLVGYRMYRRSEADPDTVRFPTRPAGEAQVSSSPG